MDEQNFDVVEKDNQIGLKAAPEAVRKHIRGSSLLLFGRLAMLGLNFGVQVITVRYLTKSDFGAFSYALSFVAITAIVSLFGLDKAIGRYIPIYQENKDYPRMLGTILLTLYAILGISAVVVALTFGFQGLIVQFTTGEPLSVSLLLIVIFIGPIQGLEGYFQGLMSVFARPQAIFFRRYLLGPALKLLAVLVVVLLNGDVYLLAVSYVVGSILGIVVYAVMMLNILKDEGLLNRLQYNQLVFPVREVFGFSLPLLTSDFLNILKGSAVVLLLQYFGTSVDVAEYRAVIPVAGLNLVVMQSFRILYTPIAARLFAQNDRQGLNNLYWKTAAWIALISFPVFVVTFSLAEPVTLLFFGERYAQSGVLLAILSFGNYFNAALGFNSYTLRVYGRVKFIVLIDVITSVSNLGINFLLIPRYGALGAAIGTCVTLIIYNLLNHAGLLLGTGINLFQRRYLLAYASILVAACGLLLFVTVFNTHIAVSIVLAGLVSVALLRFNRVALDVENMFPEILRLPLVRPILGL